MSKESKSAATIRRRRFWTPTKRDLLHRHKSHGDDNLDSDEDDPDMSQEETIQGPPVLRMIMSTEWTLFLGLLAFRVINALVIQTSFVPDEYWQSIEVAHNMAFGYGYLTWEWRTGLRSYSYPMVFAGIYKLLAILHLDYRILMIKIPRLVQAVLAAVGDLYLYKLSRRLSGHQVAVWSLLCQLTSWFTFYCITRTLTNSTETVLTTMALYYFPWPSRIRKAHWKYITLVGLSVVIRPTAAIIWVLLCTWHLSLWRHVAWKVVKHFAELGFVILSISSIIDRIFYGKWVYVHYNFLQFNVLTNMGTFYGSHPWHWYITQGFLVIMGSHMAVFVLAVKKGVEPVFLAVIGWTILMYSFLGHKEFRFLFPILPMAMHVCGHYLQYLTEESQDLDTQEEHQDVITHAKLLKETNKVIKSTDTDTEPKTLGLIRKIVRVLRRTRLLMKKGERLCKRFWRQRRNITMALIITNLPLALYTCVLHQRGTLDVMKYLSDEAMKTPQDDDMAVMFLMPCHSTPFYGYLHKNITMRFLTCEPNLARHSEYIDEADIFYNNATKWLSSELENLQERRNAFTSGHLPTHLVMFDVLQPEISSFLTNNSYQLCARFFHSHIPEGRVGGYVVVMCRGSWVPENHRRPHIIIGKGLR